jgi:glutaredoxin
MKIMFGEKRELLMIRVRILKRRRREVKVDLKLGGQWNVPSLVANGMFQVWWSMECSKLGGQWNVPNLVANGRFHVWWPMEGGGKTIFHLFHFPPNKLNLNLQFFPLTL